MKKLKLQLGELVVESFAIADVPAPRGTVQANETSGRFDGCQYPSTSCGDTQTFGEATCYCLYPETDIRVCCSNEGCTGDGLC